jgi:N-acylneuraminate cytidylyltransferase/CMP-N,N'-diacetyllegionaminic acid synthase
MKRINKKGCLSDFISSNRKITRRQMLLPVYALNGSIYLARREVLLNRRTWYTNRTYAYVMPRERSLDIDSRWDLHLAGLILKERMRHERD